MKTTAIARSTKFPKFIKEHKIFKKFNDVEKIFPLIGLDNCSEVVDTDAYLLSAASRLKNCLVNGFNRFIAGQRIARQLRACAPSDFIQNGKLIPVPNKLKKLIPGNINDFYIDLFYPYLRHPHYSRSKHYYNIYDANQYKISTNKVKIVFSSTELRGAWDIATMSMRGISSCQSWGGCFKRNLIGSIVDPFLGIIYLTDNTKTAKGEKMLKRALVRYVCHKETGKPALFLERIYPTNDNPKHSSYFLHLFKSFLEKKTNKKIPIVTNSRMYNIPGSKIVKAMSTCGFYKDGKDYCRSYRDSGIGYSKSRKVNFSKVKAF